MMLDTENSGESASNVDSKNSITESCNVASESPRNPSLEERIASKMFLYSRETICLFIGITFSLVFAALHSAPPRISRPPPARPFFNQNSVIIDFYKGQVSAMIERASDSDLSFVMYYAPWDAESQIVRNEFEIVAQHYHSQVFFAAINCWHPGSECRSQYPKIQSYPVLIVYLVRGSGVQYRGITTAPYMMRFLQSYLQPITRIYSRQELGHLLIENEIVLLGFFNFTGLAVSPGYRDFYRASVRALEKDPNREIKFAVLTNPKIASEEFNIEYFPSASLYLWNESLIYPVDKLWNSENILHWIDDSVHRVSIWLQPPGIKSLTLAPYLHQGPVLFLFTPRNPLHSTNYNYNLLQEVALEYYNCDDLWWTSTLTQYLKNERQQSKQKHYDKLKSCTQLLAEITENSTPLSISIQRWINDSCCAKVFMNKCLLCRQDQVDDICNVEPKHLYEICSQKDVFRVIHEKEDVDRHFCCNEKPPDEANSTRDLKKPTEVYFSSMITGENDPRSAENLRQRLLREHCRNFFIGSKYHYPIFPSDEEANVELEASACTMNRSMTFIAIDSLNYFHFAEGLGIDVLKMRDKTAVVILDSLQESQYVLTKNLSRGSLVKFINNFVNGSLKRTLRSDSSRRFARDFQATADCSRRKLSEICIPELTTENFLSTVLDPSRDVIVFYYSPYCAFCSAVSYVYLTVAQYLSGMTNVLFVRIDGDNNDLPWEYSMNRYPSILFFPAKRKEDSTVYPFTLPITIPNLLNFVLANLDGDSHIEALVNVCHSGAGEPPRDCVARIRRLCLDIIHSQLRMYREYSRQKHLPKLAVSNKRREILRRLEHLRDVHLILGTVDDLTTSPKFHLIVDKFRGYHRRLDKIGKKTCAIERTRLRDEL